MFEAPDVTKSFGSGNSAVTAVKDVTMSVGDGEFVTIVGRSGSGKSTLMSLIGGLEQPTSGSIQVNGEDITRFSGRQLNGYRAHGVGFVFQSYNLIPNLTAAENVMLPMEFIGRARGTQTAGATAAGPGRAHREQAVASAGQAQRRRAATRRHRQSAREQAPADPRRRADRKSRLTRQPAPSSNYYARSLTPKTPPSSW